MDLPPQVFGRSKAPAGTWGSCVRIIDPVQVCLALMSIIREAYHFSQASTVLKIALDDSEAAFSAAIVPFGTRNNELHLVIGTAVDTHLAPRTCKSGYFRTYKLSDDGRSVELVHIVS